jgi:hypothetical protein
LAGGGVAVMRGSRLATLRDGLVETQENKVAVGDVVPVPGVPLEDNLASASPDLLQE